MCKAHEQHRRVKETLIRSYPLLKELHEKGLRNSLLAIFLGNRAVKPVLLPVMISYFGLTYTLILTFLTILGALVIGYTVGALVKE